MNDINDSGIVELASIDTLKSLNLSSNHSITPEGWQRFFNSLLTRGTQLVNFDISGNKVGNEGAVVLGTLLSTMSSLKTLDMSSMSYSPSPGVSNTITTRGWQTLFTTLRDSNLDLVKLNLRSNSIDDEGIQLLVPLTSSMISLKCLDLSENWVTPSGWQALTGYLQSPNFRVRELRLDQNDINDDTVDIFTRALAQNKTLKRLSLYHNPDVGDVSDEDEDDLITERGWAAFSTFLCNKSSILDTYNSNHTLQELCDAYFYHEMGLPDDLISYLELNKNRDKAEVARQKILQTHFSSGDEATSKIQELLDMKLEVMPTTIAWIGKLTPMGWSGMNVSGLSLMYNLMRRLPDLFDSSTEKKPSMGKRKRDS